VFCIGMGVLIAFMFFWAVSTIDASAPPIFGMARRTGLGLALGLPAAANLAAGVFLLMKRNSPGVAACMLAAVSIVVAYFAVLLGTGIPIRFNLPTIMIVAVPAILISRASKALAEIE